MEETQLKTLTIDGVEHQLADFSDRVQRLVGVHQRWEKEQAEEQLELAKTQAAIRDLTREILGIVQAELAAKATPAEVAGEQVADQTAEAPATVQ
jgi:hypothetical protein